MRIHQKLASVAIALLGSAILLSACSSTQSSEVDPGSGDEQLAPSAAPMTTPPAALTVNWVTMNGSSQTSEGVPVSATIDIDPTVRRVDAVAADAQWATVLASCGAIDPQRDAILLSRVSITAEGNGFDITSGVNVGLMGAGDGTYTVNGVTMMGGTDSTVLAEAGLTSVDFGVGYTQSQCYTTSLPVLWFGVAAEIPAGSGSSTLWGPVPVAMVLHGYYGPQHPDSNPVVDSAMAFAMPFLSSTGPAAPIGNYLPAGLLPTQLSGPTLTTLDDGEPAFRLS